ncbi:MAG: 2Fe-2S iron-sulfur cluster binding domain-containing protein [Ignavibacteriales bacterium]|nr:2Fe-2S iron-sulfur cluster binding domain-containing protein [Ignavibacteriales bacterium]
MCGPSEMMENIYESAINSGLKSNNIHREVFTHSIKNESRLSKDRIARRVSIILGGRTYDLIVEPNDSILDTALNNGIDVPHSCRYGSCSSCVTKLVSGKIVMLDQTTLSDEDISRGLCLTCVGYPESDDLILNYDDPLI